MGIEFFWQLPTRGDGRHADAGISRRGERTHGAAAPFGGGISDPRGNRFNYFDYLHQIARAADLSGFDGIQIRHDLDGDESWIVAGTIARSTRHVKLLTEFEAARGSAVYAAKNAASYQRFSADRFVWQISAGGDETLRRRHGDFASAAEVLPRIGEFIEVARGVRGTEPFSFKGDYFEVLDGGFNGPLASGAVPPIYLSDDLLAHASDSDVLRTVARWADVHLFDAASTAALQPRIDALHAFSAEYGRSVGAGLRIDVLARETEQEAQRDARRFLEQSNGRVAAEGLLWSGFATAHTGGRAALIGSYQQVADALAGYAAIGVGSFILAAVPHLEETYRVGEHLLPLVRERIGSARERAA